MPDRTLSKQEKVMSKYALYVPLEAKPGKEKEVADFLKSALPLVNAEPSTVSWFAIQEGPSSFAIFDTFDNEAGREAHLNGKVAAALMAKAGELLAKPPTIHKIDIFARKLPKYLPAQPRPDFRKPPLNRGGFCYGGVLSTLLS